MSPFTRLRASLAAFGAALLLSACGGSNSGSEPMMQANACTDPGGCGTAYIAMTDADGDFLSYTVDVVSLKLRKANGAEVETLPNQTRVDFAQYVDLTEFLTAATVPNGAYVEGTLRLDYTNASVTVEKNGQPVAAQVVGANGQPLGVVDVRIVLDNRHRLVVAPGLPSLLTLDFNLAATNTVDMTTTPVTVTARPTLIASLEPVDEKEMRLRGPLVSVDTAANTYTIDVRPFNHPSAKLGRVVVHTTDTTSFEVNGQSSTGAAGLTALAAAGPGTATAAFGTLARSDHKFTAERVHAGTSVPGQGVDTVIGTIMSRTGNELTVRGGTIVRNVDSSGASTADDRAVFMRGEIKVLVGANTKVVKDGYGVQSTGAQALSVGQLVEAFGSVSSSTGANVLDATQGRVRMQFTHLLGTVVSNNPGMLTLNLASINGRPASAFNFAGTGTSSATDANPVNYEVQTPPFSIAQMLAGRPARVFGFVMPFGAAPPDFEARTLVTYTDLRAQLAVGWGPNGTAAPFSSMNASGLVLNLQNADITVPHYIRIGPVFVDLLKLSASPTIVGAASGETMYAIVSPTGITNYSDFGDFVAALTTSLGGSARIVCFNANGSYDSAANTVAAQWAVAILK